MADDAVRTACAEGERVSEKKCVACGQELPKPIHPELTKDNVGDFIIDWIRTPSWKFEQKYGKLPNCEFDHVFMRVFGLKKKED